MDIKKFSEKCPQWLKKYRYPIIIVLVGIVLMSVSGNTSTKQNSDAPPVASQVQQPDMADRLADILSQISGVGKVQVMLTVSVGETTKYHSDEDIATTENGTTIRKETIIVSGDNRTEQALITQILPPQYRGAVIVCQGGDRASVQLAVTEAVSKVTGLGADQISVLKMK